MRRESWLFLLLIVFVISLPAGIVAVVDGLALPGDASGENDKNQRIVRLDKEPAAMVTQALVLTDEIGVRRVVVARLILSSSVYVSPACAAQSHILDRVRAYVSEVPTMVPDDNAPRSRPDRRLMRRLEAIIGSRSIDRIDLQLVDRQFPYHKAQLYSCVNGTVRAVFA